MKVPRWEWVIDKNGQPWYFQVSLADCYRRWAYVEQMNALGIPAARVIERYHFACRWKIKYDADFVTQIKRYPVPFGGVPVDKLYEYFLVHALLLIKPLLSKICVTAPQTEIDFIEIESPSPVNARVRIVANDTTILEKSVELTKGRNVIKFSTSEIFRIAELTKSYTPEYRVYVGVQDVKGNMVWLFSDPFGISFIRPSISVREAMFDSEEVCANQRVNLIVPLLSKDCDSTVLVNVWLDNQRVATYAEDVKAETPTAITVPITISWSLLERYMGAENVITLSRPYPIPFRVEVRRKTSSLEQKLGEESYVLISRHTPFITLRTPPLPVAESLQIPKFARPGYNSSMSAIIRNAGQCEGRFKVEAMVAGNRVFSSNYVLDPNEETTVSVIFTVPGKDFSVILNLMRYQNGRAIKVGEISSPTIKTVQTVTLNQEEGWLKIRAGESTLSYAGIIVGRDLEAKNIVQEYVIPFAVLPIVPDKAIAVAGSVAPYQEETIEFSSIEGIRLTLSEKVSWVINGRVIDKDTDKINYGMGPATLIALLQVIKNG